MSLDLDALNPEQRAAVLHGDGPLLVLAGPGSGKTRVITSRIAWLIEERGVPASAILAVTFTNKAAGEMRDRVARITGADQPWVSTFHSFGAAFLRRESARLGIRRDFSIYDERDRLTLLKTICKALHLDTQFLRPREIAHAISDAKNRGESPEALAAQAHGFKERSIAEVYERYQGALAENSAFDFDDLLLRPADVLRSDPELRETYADRFRYLLVDEYQDTNPVQYRLTNLLGGLHQNVCVTGDPDQSIYSWRGANIGNILDFERDFPNTRVVVLGRNYRSTKTIVAAADALVRFNVQRKEKDLYTDNEEGASIRAVFCQDQDHEGNRIASMIRDLVEHEGLGFNDCAVFYRTNAQSRAIEQGLLELGLPYVLVGAVEFYKRREILDLLAWFKLLLNPDDMAALSRAISAPSRGIGEASVEKLISLARERGQNLVEALLDPAVLACFKGKPRSGLDAFGALLQKLKGLPLCPVSDLISQVVSLIDYEDYIARADPVKGPERVENIRELISDAFTFDEDVPGGELGDYLNKISLIADVDKWDPNKQAVSLMTLHSAKGLEFDAVFLSGIEDGLLPHSRAVQGSPEDIEEERRLLYVGITRARRFLTMTLARHRVINGSFMRESPSRFMKELPRELISLEDHSGEGLGTILFGKDRDGAARAASGPDDVPFDPEAISGDDAGDAQPDPWEGANISPGLALLRGRRSAKMAEQKREVVSEALNVNVEEKPALRVGDKVSHQMFGVGTIISFTKHPGGTRARILFVGWGEKNLAVEFARLTRI